MIGAPDPEYIKARRVLLDALAALEQHLDSIILVGAQAVYIHAGEGDLAVAPHTTDSDLSVDTRSLEEEPLIEDAMKTGGFVKKGHDPGVWKGAHDVTIDLMVAESQGGKGHARRPYPAPRSACNAKGSWPGRSPCRQR